MYIHGDTVASVEVVNKVLQIFNLRNIVLEKHDR